MPTPSSIFAIPVMIERVHVLSRMTTERDIPSERRAGEVVALVIVGAAAAAGGGQESPIFEFLPLAWLFQMEITAKAVSNRGGRWARVWMASVAFGYSREKKEVPFRVSSPRADFEL